VAHIYHRQTVSVGDANVFIGPIEGEEHHVAIRFDNNNEDDITEILLTRDEVKQAYELLFTRCD
jgi:hypothetical protein